MVRVSFTPHYFPSTFWWRCCLTTGWFAEAKGFSGLDAVELAASVGVAVLGIGQFDGSKGPRTDLMLQLTDSADSVADSVVDSASSMVLVGA